MYASSLVAGSVLSPNFVVEYAASVVRPAITSRPRPVTLNVLPVNEPSMCSRPMMIVIASPSGKSEASFT